MTSRLTADPWSLGLPGLYLRARPQVASVSARGRLTSQASDAQGSLWLDGLLTGEAPRDDQARYALQMWRAHGREALRHLEGYFNVIVEERSGAVAWFGDALVSRPLYLYTAAETYALAPSPTVFASWGLSMSPDRVAMLEMLRFMHQASPRSVVREVELVAPGTLYRLAPDRRELSRERVVSWHQDHTHAARSVDAVAERTRALVAEQVRRVLADPRLADAEVHMGLTSGLDSRHLLGELLAQGITPSAHHVGVLPGEAEATRVLAASVAVPLRTIGEAEIPWEQALGRWLRWTGGTVSAIQSYLMAMAEPTRSGPTVWFDGMGMDRMLGVHMTTPRGTSEDPVEALWGRSYASEAIQRAVFPDLAALRHTSTARLRALLAGVEGDPWHRLGVLEAFGRTPRYAAAVAHTLGTDAHTFGPGVHVEALRFFLREDPEVAGRKRGRYEALKRYLPRVAEAPDEFGIPVRDQSEVVKHPSVRKSQWGRALRTGLRADPMPHTPHAWLRQSAALRRIVGKALREAHVAQAGVVSGRALASTWRAHTLGMSLGRPVFSLLTLEGAYRTLIEGEHPDQVVASWLA